MTRFIAELGSNHYGDIKRLQRAVDMLADTGIALKLQLFKNEPPFVPPNIYLSPELFTRTFEYGLKKNVVVSASVFDDNNLEFLIKHQPQFIKIAYSKKQQSDWIKRISASGAEAIVSCDVMSLKDVQGIVTKLFCIAQYPVMFDIAFDGLFVAGKFHGFSDHSIGLRQTLKAVHAGASIIEKHVKLDLFDNRCPDDAFAVPLSQFMDLYSVI